MPEDDALSGEGFGVWMTLTELAEARGVGKAALSERVSKLESMGAITTKARGRAKLINVVEFDRAIGETTDLAREQGQATRRGEPEDDEASSNRAIFTREQAKRAGYDAELARLNLEERLGQLVKVSELRPAIEKAVAAMAEAIDTLAHEADALRELAHDEDMTKFDRALRDLARRVRTEAAAKFRKALAGHATE